MQTRTKYLEKLEDLSALLGQLGEKSVLDVRAVGRALAGEEQAAEGVVAGDRQAVICVRPSRIGALTSC